MNDFFFYNQDIIAKTSVNVLHDTIKSSSDKFKAIFDVKQILLNKHQGSTVLSNSLEFFFIGLSNTNILEQSKQKKEKIERELTNKIKHLSSLASKKIKNKGDIFIHSVNNQILDIVFHASKYKKFKVHLLEHQPHMVGRDAIIKLEKNKISYSLYPDLALEKAISSSDICFIGAEAILNNKGAIVKTGTKLVSNIAKQLNCPTYICAHSWKFDYKKTGLLLLNHKTGEKNPIEIFEYLPDSEIESYITEYGIYRPEQAIEEIKYFNKWMML